jgi:hypothetical protein
MAVSVNEISDGVSRLAVGLRMHKLQSVKRPADPKVRLGRSLEVIDIDAATAAGGCSYEARHRQKQCSEPHKQKSMAPFALTTTAGGLPPAEWGWVTTQSRSRLATAPFE